MKWKETNPDNPAGSVDELREMIAHGTIDEQLQSFLDRLLTNPTEKFQCTLADNRETFTVRLKARRGIESGTPPYRDIGEIWAETSITASFRRNHDWTGKRIEMENLYATESPFNDLAKAICSFFEDTSINASHEEFLTTDNTYLYENPRYNNPYSHITHSLHTHPRE